MRPLQNVLITDNARFFESLLLSWKTSHTVSEWAWIWQSSWCLQSTKFIILISWSLVCTSIIPCHYHWNGRRYWLRRHTEESGQSRKIINTIRVKSLEGRAFIFIFKLNTVLSNSYQVDEIVMDIEEWKQKVPDDYVKSFSRVLLGLSETLIVS